MTMSWPLCRGCANNLLLLVGGVPSGRLRRRVVRVAPPPEPRPGGGIFLPTSHRLVAWWREVEVLWQNRAPLAHGGAVHVQLLGDGDVPLRGLASTSQHDASTQGERLGRPGAALQALQRLSIEIREAKRGRTRSVRHGSLQHGSPLHAAPPGPSRSLSSDSDH